MTQYIPLQIHIIPHLEKKCKCFFKFFEKYFFFHGIFGFLAVFTHLSTKISDLLLSGY